MDPISFLSKIVALRLAVPFSVTSWLRTRARNAQVEGAPDSLHLLGLAVDISLDDPADLKLLISRADRIGIKVLTEKDHLHLQPA